MSELEHVWSYEDFLTAHHTLNALEAAEAQAHGLT
jgi:hypothetical protein